MENSFARKAEWVIVGASQVVTCAQGRGDAPGVIEGGVVAGAGETILAVGTEREARSSADLSRAAVIDAAGGVVLPGFVDSHTHLVFGGTRLDEYVAKCTGADLEALKARGVAGVNASVSATRGASLESLVEQTAARLSNMVECGTTTVEIKSGYGFTTESEIRMLEAAAELGRRLPVDVLPTFLGAHGWPPEMTRESYLDLIVKEMLPEVAKRKLAVFCDAWCEDTHFSAAECGRILSAAKDLGMRARIHTDAYSYVGGSDLAAELGAMSADHLNFTPPGALRKLAEAGTVCTPLPVTDFSVSHPRPFDPAPMRQAGVTMAIASNCNPGAWSEAVPFALVLACRRHGVTPAEAVVGATLNGAKALGLDGDRGSLEPGKLADVQVWKARRYEEVFYRYGTKIVDKVMKRGRLVVEGGRLKGRG